MDHNLWAKVYDHKIWLILHFENSYSFPSYWWSDLFINIQWLDMFTVYY